MSKLHDLIARAYVRGSNYKMPIEQAYEFADHDLKKG